jgi:hypothetical protein
MAAPAYSWNLFCLTWVAGGCGFASGLFGKAPPAVTPQPKATVALQRRGPHEQRVRCKGRRRAARQAAPGTLGRQVSAGWQAAGMCPPSTSALNASWHRDHVSIPLAAGRPSPEAPGSSECRAGHALTPPSQRGALGGSTSREAALPPIHPSAVASARVARNCGVDPKGSHTQTSAGTLDTACARLLGKAGTA